MVELVRSGRTPVELAREFEPVASTIRSWVIQADRDEGRRTDGLTSVEREELRRLRRENKRLRMEREILAKAAAWFARETESIPTKSSRGFIYLGAVVDAFSRRVVGWSLATRLEKDLVIKAFDMAVAQRNSRGVIHQSDHGSQYTSMEFGKRCMDAGVALSMGSVGDCYDNSMAESFFATLECVLLGQKRFDTPQETFYD
jgi:transposase InsO family protein